MSQPCVAHFSPKSRTTPTHAHHKCCHNLREACVTLCHLRFCRIYANAAPPIRAARVSKRYQKIRTPNRIQHQPPTQSVPPPLHSPGPSRMPPAQPRRRSKFRRFDFSTFRRFRQENHPNREPPQPTPATSVGTIPKPLCHLMSPSLLQDLRAIKAFVFTLDPFAPRSLGPFFSPIVTFDFAALTRDQGGRLPLAGAGLS